MMRLWRAALLRELRLLGQPGAAGGGPGPGSRSRRLLPQLAALSAGPAARRGPGPARGLCTRSEGALEEPGKGAQQPAAPGEPPVDGGRNNNHGGGGKELAGGGGGGEK